MTLIKKISEVSDLLMSGGKAGGQTLIGGTGASDILKLQGTSGNGSLTSPSVQILVGNNGATIGLTVLNNGNIGIGTTTPGAALDVQKPASGDYLNISNDLHGDIVTITDAGNLGIGTTAPGAKLEVANLNPGTLSAVRVTSYSTSYYTDLVMDASGQSNSYINFVTSGGGDPPFHIKINGNEKLTVLRSGNLGIGITSPTAKLHLPACTASANTASLKINSGVVATTPVSGNIESDGIHLYWTDSGNTRRQLDN